MMTKHRSRYLRAEIFFTLGVYTKYIFSRTLARRESDADIRTYIRTQARMCTCTRTGYHVYRAEVWGPGAGGEGN